MSLHVACAKGDITSVRQLIESGADVNATDTGGRSPLLYAVSEAHENIVQFLIDHHANVNFMTLDGASPLRVAIDKGHYSVMRTLLKHGANPNELGPKG
ncbi:ankyrin, partial [Serendipita vermifera]